MDNPWLLITSRIVKREDGYHILGETGKHLGGPYSKEHAEERLKDIEMFKHIKKAKLNMNEIKYNEEDIVEGQSVELEHKDTLLKLINDVLSGKDIAIEDYAKLIAKDHLAEDPLYYKKLLKMGL